MQPDFMTSGDTDLFDGVDLSQSSIGVHVTQHFKGLNR